MLVILVQIAPYLSIFYTRSPPPPPMKNVLAHLLENLIHISIRILANVHVENVSICPPSISWMSQAVLVPGAAKKHIVAYARTFYTHYALLTIHLVHKSS